MDTTVATPKVTVTVRQMNWFWKAFLYVWAFLAGCGTIVGFTTFWHTIYLREGRTTDRALLAHELTHVKQIDQLGIFKFTWQYVRENIKVGYRNNHFEVEARAAAKLKVEETLASVNIDCKYGHKF